MASKMRWKQMHSQSQIRLYGSDRWEKEDKTRGGHVMGGAVRRLTATEIAALPPMVPPRSITRGYKGAAAVAKRQRTAPASRPAVAQRDPEEWTRGIPAWWEADAPKPDTASCAERLARKNAEHEQAVALAAALGYDSSHVTLRERVGIKTCLVIHDRTGTRIRCIDGDQLRDMEDAGLVKVDGLVSALFGDSK